MPEQKPGNKLAAEIDEKELLKDEPPVKPATPLERILQSFKKLGPASKPAESPSAKDLGKDKSKSLLLIAGSGVVGLLLLVAHFSSPQNPNRTQVSTHRGQPDLGQRTTPGQAPKQAGSVVPALTADVRDQQTAGSGQVTPEDISRLGHVSSQGAVVKANRTANTLVPPEAKNPDSSPYALGHIDFSDPDLQRRYAQSGSSPHLEVAAESASRASSNPEAELKKPSLVFVSNPNNAVPNAGGSSARGESEWGRAGGLEAEGTPLDSVLPAGTRLVVRLESPACTAVAAPVVATIEYNYEHDGEIVVPAGSKTLGKLDQANSSGYVSLRFDRIEFPDGTTARMDGTSMGLDFAPIKGLVSGRRRGSQFLVQTLTGVGTVAAYLVGANNLSGPVSNGALLRERLADNVAIAGQSEMNQVAFNQNIMVTVPGNTRFYVVLQQTANSPRQPAAARRLSSAAGSTGDSQPLPSLQELRQLLQLRQELSQLYRQESSEKAVPDDSQPQ